MENTKENMQSRNIGICQMVVCAVLWSIAGVFIGLLDMNGFVIAGGRSLFAALTVLAYMALTKQKIIFSRDTLVSGILLCGDHGGKRHRPAIHRADLHSDFLVSVPAQKAACTGRCHGAADARRHLALLL